MSDKEYKIPAGSILTSELMNMAQRRSDGMPENMNYLLKEAIQIGIYQRVDYKVNPIDYCGMEINNTPLNME